ncbi:chitin binding peritrophin-A domain-containing protein [Sphingobacterium sp.]|uniref:chitin binding peritrophin-A domain-containing protein n=1 Tax=Sphingobacterium sp. TaxID=341027 RepID=UPI002FDE6518
MKKVIFSLLLLSGLGAMAQVGFDPDFCKKKQQGYYPHPTECNAVYICNTDYSDYTHLVFCHEGLVWNEATNQCDFPSNVVGPCGKEQ